MITGVNLFPLQLNDGKPQSSARCFVYVKFPNYLRIPLDGQFRPSVVVF
jgi:hypothetical protein